MSLTLAHTVHVDFIDKSILTSDCVRSGAAKEVQCWHKKQCIRSLAAERMAHVQWYDGGVAKKNQVSRIPNLKEEREEKQDVATPVLKNGADVNSKEEKEKRPFRHQ